MQEKFILDACCGRKYMWYDKHHPNAIYIDNRKVSFNANRRRSGKIKGERIHIDPDIIMDFRDLKFPDKSFKLVVCDPPHLRTLSNTSEFKKIYGGLNAETWEADLRKGFKEMFRVLKDYGIFILKWNDAEIPIKTLLRLIPYPPLFRNITSTRPKTDKTTSWFCFMKIPDATK